MSFAAAFELRGSLPAALRLPWPRTPRRRSRPIGPDPSFQGAYLPATSTIGPDGFAAEWRIPHLGRNYPQSWSRTEHGAAIGESAFGFDLLTPVDAYRQTERSLKYQILFLGLTFSRSGSSRRRAARGCIRSNTCLSARQWVFSICWSWRWSRTAGFPIAYSLAAALVTGLVFFYAGSALDSRRRALAVGGRPGRPLCLPVRAAATPGLCAFGGVARAVVILAAVMYATRNVDWYAARVAAPRPGAPPAGDR